MKFNKAFAISVVMLGVSSSVFGCGKKEVAVESTEATEPVVVKKDTEIIRENVNKLYASGAYVSASVSDDMALNFCFDKNGRAYVESPYTCGIFVEKDKCLMATSNEGKPYFEFYEDITPMYLIELMCDYADKGLVSVKKDGDTLEDGIIYTMTTSGDNIYSIFKEVSEKYADSKLDLFGYTNVSEFNNSDKLNVTVALEEDNLATSAEILLKNESEPYTLWICDGYLGFGDWEIDNEYWNESLNTSEFKDVEEKLEDIQSEISTKITEYLDKHPELVEIEEATVSETSEETDKVEETAKVDETDSEEVDETSESTEEAVG